MQLIIDTDQGHKLYCGSCALSAIHVLAVKHTWVPWPFSSGCVPDVSSGLRLYRQMELVSPADAKRGPGRPPVRQSSQGIVPRGGGGSGSKRGRIGRQLSDLGATPAAAAYGTNELVGRKIWCVLAAIDVEA